MTEAQVEGLSFSLSDKTPSRLPKATTALTTGGRERNETASVYTIPRSAVEGAKSAWWTDGPAAGGEANDFLFLLFQAERERWGSLLSPIRSPSVAIRLALVEVGAWAAAATDPASLLCTSQSE